MKLLSASLAFAFALHCQPVLSGSLTGFTLATWNIQTLATAGRKVFDKSAARKAQDYEDLRIVERAIGADVYALEEVTSPAAIALVFPLAEFAICISGQWTADARNLGPIYDFSAIATSDIKPLCFDDPAAALPDTAVTPGLSPGDVDPLLGQYTGVAVRKKSKVKLDAVADLARLGIAQNDKDNAGNFVVRKVRWGLDATLSSGGSSFHLLTVHMKSGCFDGFLTPDFWNVAVDPWKVAPKKDHACEVYARQLPTLRKWIADRKFANETFIMAGDFNRRLDLELLDAKKPDLWPIITGSETASNSSDDIALSHIPRGETIATGKACWSGRPEAENVAIDFFIFSPGSEPDDWKARTTKIFFTDLKRPNGSKLTTGDAEADAAKLSDHCPRSIRF